MNDRLGMRTGRNVEDAGAFEAQGYRIAVLSFIREFLGAGSAAPSDIEGLSVHSGLKVIRRLIDEKSRSKRAGTEQVLSSGLSGS